MDDLEPASREEIREVAREGRQLIHECQVLQEQQDARIGIITADVRVALQDWNSSDARSLERRQMMTETMEHVISMLGESNRLAQSNFESIQCQSDRLTNALSADADEKLMTLRSARDEIVQVIRGDFAHRQSVLEEYEAAVRALQPFVARRFVPRVITWPLRRFWRT